MGEKTIYLLYNANAIDVELHEAKTRTDDGSRIVWEYIDKDEFTVTYGPSNERKYIGIKTFSKTKLKERPKSADTLIDRQKIDIEGILFRRTSSLCNMDEIILMRSPLIKPLVSETVITQLQRFQQDCMRHQYERVRKSTAGQSTKNILQETFRMEQDGGKENTINTKTRKFLHSINSKSKRKITSVGFPKHIQARTATEFGQKKDSLKKEEAVKKKKSMGNFQSEIVSSKAVKKNTLKQKENSKKITRNYGNKEDVKGAKDISKNLTFKSSTVADLPKKRLKNIEGDDYKEGKYTKKSKSPFGMEEQRVTTSHNKSREDKNRQLKKDNIEIEMSTSKDTSILNNKEEIEKKKDIITKGKSSSMSEKSMKLNKSGKYIQPYKSKIDVESKKGVQKERFVISRNDVNSERNTSGIPGTLTDEQESVPKEAYSREKSKKSLNKSTKIRYETEKEKTPNDKATNRDEVTGGYGKTKRVNPTSKSPKHLELNTPSGRKSRRSSGHLSFSLTKGKLKGLARKQSPSSTFKYMIQYVLSNPVFIKLGFTLQPTDRALTRVVTFKAFPANPHIYCFREREERETKYYSSGILAVKIEKNGTGIIYYHSGSTAMVSKRIDMGSRLMLYSDPKKDPLIKDSYRSRVLGMFDSYGNGVVYDTQGKKILNYNQLEGIFYNPLRKTPYKWRWRGYEILEKQRLKELLSSMVKEEKHTPNVHGKTGVTPLVTKKQIVENKTPVDKEYEYLLAQLPYPVPPKRKSRKETHSSSFKSIIFKINDEMTLRINGQDSVCVYFSSEKVFYRHDLGVNVDPETVERIEDLSPEKLCDVPCVFEALLNLSPSLQSPN